MSISTAGVTSSSSAADIARRSKKQSVGDQEPQFVLGVVAQTAGLKGRIHAAMIAKGWSWYDLAHALVLTRQAVLMSIERRHVQYSRVRQIALLLNVPVSQLLDEQWNCAANDKIL